MELSLRSCLVFLFLFLTCTSLLFSFSACLIKLLLYLEVNSFSNLQLFVQRCSLLERTKAGDRRVAAVEPHLVG